jgi:hypothetical protein
MSAYGGFRLERIHVDGTRERKWFPSHTYFSKAGSGSPAKDKDES